EVPMRGTLRVRCAAAPRNGRGARFRRLASSGQCGRRLPRGDEALADESTGRANDSPYATELGHVLAEDLTRFPVADVVVERAAEVGDLKLAAGSLNRAKVSANHT